MSNTYYITIHDFENICRTCLSTDDLKPLYEKYSSSTSLSDMLMACTSVTFSEDDGFPLNICANCINEINHAFSFARRCETTDAILRKCVAKIETEVPDNLFPSHSGESIIEEEDNEGEREIAPGIEHLILTLPDNLSPSHTVESIIQEEEEEFKPGIEHLTIKDVNYEFLEKVKHQDDVKIESEEYVEVEQVHIKIDEFGENKQENVKDAVNVNYEDVDVGQDDTYSETSESSEEQDYFSPGKRRKKNCQKSFTRLDSLNVQKVKLPNETLRGDFQCTLCDLSFATKIILDQHSIIHGESSDVRTLMSSLHIEEKTYTCGVCSKAFTKNSNLTNHMKIHTGEKAYSCEVCNKVFTQISYLRHHKKVHTGKKPHICGVCSKGFSQGANLTKHMKIHTGEKSYSCEVCSKLFSQSSNLTTHMKVHLGEKPHICEVCSKGFTEKAALTNHMRVHTGEKPYPCGVCSKVFSRSANLIRHMKVHTGEKPHTCCICSRDFTEKSNLTKHMKVHTGEKPHTCEICSKGFSQIIHLTKHMRIHAGGSPTPV